MFNQHFILIDLFQTETLTNGSVKSAEAVESSDSDSDNGSSNPAKRQLTDEEIFQACGGLTAHK